MPLNVRRFYSLLFLAVFGVFAAADAQTVPPASPATNTASNPATAQTAQQQQQIQQIRTPTAAEIMRDRIAKAKAYIAVRNYSAANYELESIRRESADPSVQAGVSVLLMNSYLEQGDYKRAQDFLNQAYNITKTTTPNAAASYFTIASQVVSGARNRVERYHALGLNPSDRTLPLEAVNDLERMREMLELVVTQSKEISKDKSKSADGLALLDAAATSRSMIARDDYDARKWQNEVADAREDLANSRSVVLSAVTDAPANAIPSQTNTAMSQPSQQQNQVITNATFKESVPLTTQNKPSDNLVKSTVSQQPVAQPAKNDQPQYVPTTQQERNRVASNQPAPQPVAQTPAQNPPVQSAANQQSNQSVSGPPSQAVTKSASEPAKSSGPLDVGSLLAYATKQSQPVYPVAAKNLRTTGMVKVEVTVDEEGNVAVVQNASGPALLQGAAKDAIKKWRFRPFVKDGQPVKAIGYVNFNFAL